MNHDDYPLRIEAINNPPDWANEKLQVWDDEYLKARILPFKFFCGINPFFWQRKRQEEPTGSSHQPGQCPELWTALADLFLDTEITDRNYGYIKRVAKKNGFSLNQTLEVLENEVFLVFISNLECVTGEWGGFSQEHVTEAVQRFLAQPVWLRKLQDLTLIFGWRAVILTEMKQKISQAFRENFSPENGST